MDIKKLNEELEVALHEEVATPIESGEISYVTTAMYQILHSEYRDEGILDKYYGYVEFFDQYGNSSDYITTSNCTSREDVIKEIEDSLNSPSTKIIFKPIEELS